MARHTAQIDDLTEKLANANKDGDKKFRELEERMDAKLHHLRKVSWSDRPAGTLRVPWASPLDELNHTTPRQRAPPSDEPCNPPAVTLRVR